MRLPEQEAELENVKSRQHNLQHPPDPNPTPSRISNNDDDDDDDETLNTTMEMADDENGPNRAIIETNEKISETEKQRQVDGNSDASGLCQVIEVTKISTTGSGDVDGGDDGDDGDVGDGDGANITQNVQESNSQTFYVFIISIEQ